MSDTTPDVIMRGVPFDSMYWAVRVADAFVRDWPDRRANDSIICSNGIDPDLVIYWTKARAVCVRANQ